MDKYCERCYARDAKPCMECSTCNPGHHNFRSAPTLPPTHADCIRFMSDEELTRFIQSDLPIFRTFKQQLDWLQQPAEEVAPNDTD